MSLAELPTPSALVDADAVERNTTRMARRAREQGCSLRPHVKTHKCVEAARLSVRGHFGGVTVSTLAEARFFAAAGFDDLTYAVPIAPAKVPAATALAREVGRLGLLVDHPDAARALSEAARAASMRHAVHLKVDCGYHRAGVLPEDPGALRLAQELAADEHLDFRGLLTHAGHSYDARGPDEIRAVARQERDVVVAFAERLRAAGVEVAEVSIGSTPTAVWADGLEGVTELRPGNYVFFDAFQAAIGSCVLADAAFSVLTTVIGVYPERGEAIVDAGALALSKDPGATHVDPRCGFGRVRTLAGEELDHVRVVELSQEHGKLRATGSLPAWRIGDRLQIVPNHACLAAARFDRYHVVGENGRVTDVWRTVPAG